MQTFFQPKFAPLLWRSKDQVQFGIHPTDCVRMSKEIALSILPQQDCAVDVPDDVTPEHLIAMHREQLEPNELSKRVDTEIVIIGAGRMGTTIAVLLANAGYPTIRVHDKQPVTLADVTTWGASRIDVGMRRDFTAHLIIERIYRGTWPRILRKMQTATRKLVILCPDPVADWPWFAPNLTDDLISKDQPHIVVASSPSNVHFSSVIVPGKSACMRCHDAHLTEIDSAWPLITSQLIGRPMLDVTPSGLILYAAHFITQAVHRWVIEKQADANRLWDIAWPSFNATYNSMSVHPACGCQWNQQYSS